MSWEQLQSILAEREAERARRDAEPPTACPHDGEPLGVASSGELFCPWGDFRWPRDDIAAVR